MRSNPTHCPVSSLTSWTTCIFITITLKNIWHKHVLFILYNKRFLIVYYRPSLSDIYGTMHKNFANPHELLHYGSHLWQLALASHCSPQSCEQCFTKNGFMAKYIWILDHKELNVFYSLWCASLRHKQVIAHEGYHHSENIPKLANS